MISKSLFNSIGNKEALQNFKQGREVNSSSVQWDKLKERKKKEAVTVAGKFSIWPEGS